MKIYCSSERVMITFSKIPLETSNIWLQRYYVCWNWSVVRWIQYDDQLLVGFLMGYYKEFDDLKSFFLEEIVVFANCHNQGYGTKFMEWLQGRIVASGAEHMELISVNNEHHIHFYGKLGCYKATNLVMMGKHFD